MGVRFRKYLFKDEKGKHISICKDIDCKGEKGKHCPPNRRHNLNGEYVKCGTWVVELFDESNQWKSVVYRDVRNRSGAETRLALAIGDREREILQLPRRRNNMPTLADYCKQYLKSAGNDKENTFLSKARAVKALTKHLGGYKLDRITKFLIEKYRINRKNKDAVKEATVNLDVNILSNICNRAIDESIIDKNPCSKVKRFKIEQKRDRVLTGAEIAVIFDRLKGKDRLMVLTGLFGGLRLGEMLELRKGDIDFSRNVMTFVQIKTGKLINVPISDFLAQEFKEYMVSHQDDRIFDSREVNLSLVKKYSRYFADLFKKLGIDRFTYHNLRHCFSSSLSDSGADAFTTQSLLGHSDVSMTARYTHKQIESKRKAVEAMTEHVLGMKKGKLSKLMVRQDHDLSIST